jgi:hypothetical protein
MSGKSDSGCPPGVTSGLDEKTNPPLGPLPDSSAGVTLLTLTIDTRGHAPARMRIVGMNPSDRDDHELSNKETQAFDSPLIHEEKIERSAPGDEENENEKETGSAEVEESEENKGKTELVTKEAMVRVTSGQL